jgi:hypothetical protein
MPKIARKSGLWLDHFPAPAKRDTTRNVAPQQIAINTYFGE